LNALINWFTPFSSERALLNRLMIELSKLDCDVLVGHNISGFDLDVLLHRAQVFLIIMCSVASYIQPVAHYSSWVHKFVWVLFINYLGFIPGSFKGTCIIYFWLSFSYLMILLDMQSAKQHVVQDWSSQAIINAQAYQRKHTLWFWSKSRNYVLYCWPSSLWHLFMLSWPSEGGNLQCVCFFDNGRQLTIQFLNIISVTKFSS